MLKINESGKINEQGEINLMLESSSKKMTEFFSNKIKQL